MYAGIPGIIMTLWEIEDKSGYDIMTHFYKYLSQGKDRDESIRLAKHGLLQAAGKLHAHPYFWAAYINIGDNSPVYTKNRHTHLGSSGVSSRLVADSGRVSPGEEMEGILIIFSAFA